MQEMLSYCFSQQTCLKLIMIHGSENFAFCIAADEQTTQLLAFSGFYVTSKVLQSPTYRHLR